MLSSNQERVYFPIRGSRGRGFSPSGQRRHETRCQPRGERAEREGMRLDNTDYFPWRRAVNLATRTRRLPLKKLTGSMFEPSDRRLDSKFIFPAVSSSDRGPFPVEAEPSLDLSRNFLLLFPRVLSSARRFSASCESRDNAREKPRATSRSIAIASYDSGYALCAYKQRSELCVGELRMDNWSGGFGW